MLNNIILIVDDDENITSLLKKYFSNENFTVITAADGVEAVNAIKKNKPDVVVLDLMLPKMDGFEVLRQTRKAGLNLPVLMLTSRDEEADKLVGLEIGADDYIAKPFSPKEVVARVRAVLRRVKGAEKPPTEAIKIGKLTIDVAKHEITKADKSIEMTPIEFKILELLCKNPGQTFTRLQMIERAQGYDFEGYERTVDAHIKNIRKKIEKDPQNPEYLLTVFGVGYKIVNPEKKK